MARSNSYDFTKEDVEEMFGAMQSTLNDVRAEFNKKFEEKARNEKKVFSFGNTKVVAEKVEDVAVKKNVVLQFDFGEYVSEEIVESCIKAYQTENRAKVKSIDVYVKPADMKAYYVVNGKSAGSVDL